MNKFLSKKIYLFFLDICFFDDLKQKNFYFVNLFKCLNYFKRLLVYKDIVFYLHDFLIFLLNFSDLKKDYILKNIDKICFFYYNKNIYSSNFLLDFLSYYNTDIYNFFLLFSNLKIRFSNSFNLIFLFLKFL